jgi:hypothetical protein
LFKKIPLIFQQGYLLTPTPAPASSAQPTLYPHLYPNQPVYTIAAVPPPQTYQVPVAGQTNSSILIQPSVLNQPVTGHVWARAQTAPYDRRNFTCMCGIHVHVRSFCLRIFVGLKCGVFA